MNQPVRSKLSHLFLDQAMLSTPQQLRKDPKVDLVSTPLLIDLYVSTLDYFDWHDMCEEGSLLVHLSVGRSMDDQSYRMYLTFISHFLDSEVT